MSCGGRGLGAPDAGDLLVPAEQHAQAAADFVLSDSELAQVPQQQQRVGASDGAVLLGDLIHLRERWQRRGAVTEELAR